MSYNIFLVLLTNLQIHVKLCSSLVICISVIQFPVYYICIYRNLVSASQDGKLIVWDGYTTNKVLTDITVQLLYKCVFVLA